MINGSGINFSYLQVTRLSRIRDDIESELEELTASLFQVWMGSCLQTMKRKYLVYASVANPKKYISNSDLDPKNFFSDTDSDSTHVVKEI
jgi:hypothetical protein